jgi:hypothetical protein
MEVLWLQLVLISCLRFEKSKVRQVEITSRSSNAREEDVEKEEEEEEEEEYIL